MASNDEIDLWELLDALYDEPESKEVINKIRELIAAGECDLNEEMPLLVAVNTGALEVVKLLVEAGADVNQVNPENFETALFRARYLDFQDIAEYLEPLTNLDNRDIVESMMLQNQPKKSKKKH
jgi:ankyrin repeat protein